MCTMVGVLRDGKLDELCDTAQELADALGISPAEVSDDPPDHCLCNAKLDALGARKATMLEGWPYPEYVIAPPNAGVKAPAP